MVSYPETSMQHRFSLTQNLKLATDCAIIGGETKSGDQVYNSRIYNLVIKGDYISKA